MLLSLERTPHCVDARWRCKARVGRVWTCPLCAGREDRVLRGVSCTSRLRMLVLVHSEFPPGLGTTTPPPSPELHSGSEANINMPCVSR
eukprot:53602-Chlamydomonas_euryale.AAC.4